MKYYQTIDNCRLCNNKKFINVLNLGKQSLSGIFHDKKNAKEIKTPLEWIKCNGKNSCGLIQLRHSANISKMYGQTYGYHSSISSLMIDHLKLKYNKINNFLNLSSKNNILDIGCNDGTFLGFFKKNKCKRFGIDPSSKKFKKYFQKNIDVAYKFFSKENVIKSFGEKKFKLISSIAMFYDIENPISFAKDIYDLLEDDGIWVNELSYNPLLFQNLTYDQICHEHVTYWGLREMQFLLEKANLQIVDFDFNEINGGSFSLIITKKNCKTYKIKKKKIIKILNYEKKFHKINYLKKYKLRINNHKTKLIKFLKKSKKENITVYGYGASTKGNIVLNYCNITEKLLNSIADEQKEKHGLFTPGTKIKIISKNKVRKINPKYILVLIWPFRKEVLLQEKEYIFNGGQLVFSLPRFHIVNKKNYKKYLNEPLSKLGFKN
jgi:NDP-4-keto-2,6-dideoxyhexose 3-C-methyltransferase